MRKVWSSRRLQSCSPRRLRTSFKSNLDIFLRELELGWEFAKNVSQNPERRIIPHRCAWPTCLSCLLRRAKSGWPSQPQLVRWPLGKGQFVQWTPVSTSKSYHCCTENDYKCLLKWSIINYLVWCVLLAKNWGSRSAERPFGYQASLEMEYRLRNRENFSRSSGVFHTKPT